MDQLIKTHIANIRSSDRDVQGNAFTALMEMTKQPVAWAYDVWDELLKDLSNKDNRLRSIAAQILCNLAKSDPEGRMLQDFDQLLTVTRDEKFVTARHCLQSLWKVGLAGKKQKKRLLEGLELRFNECINEKNCTLFRYDIIQVLRRLYDEDPDEAIRKKAIEWIETEGDLKYRKKYSGLWKLK